MSNRYKILYAKQGLKDKKNAFKVGYGKKIENILTMLKKILLQIIPLMKN